MRPHPCINPHIVSHYVFHSTWAGDKQIRKNFKTLERYMLHRLVCTTIDLRASACLNISMLVPPQHQHTYIFMWWIITELSCGFQKKKKKQKPKPNQTPRNSEPASFTIKPETEPKLKKIRCIHAYYCSYQKKLLTGSCMTLAIMCFHSSWSASC